MRRPRSLTAAIAHAPIVRNAPARRVLLSLAVAICAVLTLFPQKYRAAMSLTPADPLTLGLGQTVSQLGAFNSVFGDQSALEISLKIADSPYVRNEVAQQLKLESVLGMSHVEVLRWLERKAHVRSLRGGIIQIDIELEDADLARKIVATYGDSVREQLASVNRNQTGYKRQILLDLVADASDRLEKAQSDYDSFRLRTRYSAPGRAIMAIGDRVPALQQAIQAKRVELDTQRKFATDENIRVQQLEAEIGSLKAQLKEAQSTSPENANSVGVAVEQSTKADRLERDLDLAKGLYENYRRFLLGTSVEELTATANVRVLEPAYIDPARQYNLVPLLLGVIIVLLGLVVEFYNWRPSVRDAGRGNQPSGARLEDTGTTE